MRSRGGTTPGRRSRSVPGLNVIASRSAYDDAPDLSEGLTAAIVEGYFGRFEAFFLPAAQWGNRSAKRSGRGPDSPSIAGVTPQAIANRAVKPLFEIDGRKMYRLGDIHGHDGARVADAMESAWTIWIEGIMWAVASAEARARRRPGAPPARPARRPDRHQQFDRMTALAVSTGICFVRRAGKRLAATTTTVNTCGFPSEFYPQGKSCPISCFSSVHRFASQRRPRLLPPISAPGG